MQFLNARLICVAFPLMMIAASSGTGSSDLFSEPWQLSTQDLQTSPKPAATSLYRANLSQTFSLTPVAPANVRLLVPDSQRPHTEGVLASTTWLNGAFSTETEVANTQGNTVGLQPGASHDPAEDPRARMMRLGLSASSGSVRYGLAYRTAGEAFATAPDQTSREVWGEWKNGWTTVRSAIGQQWNNVDGDPARSRLEQQYGNLALSVKRPVWPMLSMTYSQNASSNTIDPTGGAASRLTNHTLQAALAYHAQAWDASLASSYIVGTDPLRTGGDGHVNQQTATVSFNPVNTVIITPSLGYRTEQEDWSGVHVDSPSASLAMSYRQSQQVLITASGNYSGTRSSDRLTDLENLGGKGILTWGLESSPSWATMISVETGYNRQINRLLPADTQEFSGLMRFVLAPF